MSITTLRGDPIPRKWRRLYFQRLSRTSVLVPTALNCPLNRGKSTQHLWNDCANQQVYDVDTTDFPDIFTMLDPEETEDLVFLYLQSQGWYVVPNSRKGNTLRFEFMLAHSETGAKALTQVKTGDVQLNVDCYANHPWHIFLFQSNEYYEGQRADNVTCIRRDDLDAFLQDTVHLFPQSFGRSSRWLLAGSRFRVTADQVEWVESTEGCLPARAPEHYLVTSRFLY